jgi:NAD(P)-dependent dehydrogenase (short-subunit alcohol dehydrogenase family)
MPFLTNTTSSQPLEGQVAAVTGAGRGIGRAIALKLAELGARTVLCGRNREALEQTSTAIENSSKNSGKTSIIECDVTDLHSVESMAERVERTFHRLDILVNNAGIGGAGGPLHQLTPDNWDRVLNTNLRGVYYCISSLAPMMIKARAGHIINISSLAGKNALPNGAAYAASKWGLNGLSYSVAEELRAHNIRVSVVCPGSVHTEFSPHPRKNEEKMLQAADVAHVVAMLVTQAPQSFASEVLLRPTQKP